MADIGFKGLEIWKAEFPFRLRFSHNLADRRSGETILVFIASDRGTLGCGQALPRSYLTGESLESVVEDISKHWWPKLAALRLPCSKDIGEALERLAPWYEEADALRHLSAYSALEMAVMDGYGREQGIPARLPRELSHSKIPLVGVIPAVGANKAVWMARILSWLGYRRFKVKVGHDANADMRRLAAVRKVIGSDAWLAVDANAAWTSSDAGERMAGLRHYNVSVVEEPLQRDKSTPEQLAALEADSGIPVMADESLCTFADAQALLAAGGPSWWNLRFAKNGGFLGLSRLSSLAKENSITVYQGILVGETSVLAAAARGTMSGVAPLCAEYGFPRIFIKGDPFRGGPGGFHGTMETVGDATPGLGIHPIRRLLEDKASPVWTGGDKVWM